MAFLFLVCSSASPFTRSKQRSNPSHDPPLSLSFFCVFFFFFFFFHHRCVCAPAGTDWIGANQPFSFFSLSLSLYITLSAVHLFLPFLLLLFCRPPSSFSTYFFSLGRVSCALARLQRRTQTPLCDGERHQTASQTMSFVCPTSLSLSLSFFLASSLPTSFSLDSSSSFIQWIYIFIHIWDIKMALPAAAAAASVCSYGILRDRR